MQRTPDLDLDPCVEIVSMRTHLFSGDVEGDLLGDFLLADVEDFVETSSRETADLGLLFQSVLKLYQFKFHTNQRVSCLRTN